MSGTYCLSAKNTVATEMLRYIEQITPNTDENKRALAVLGIDNGNRINPENRIPTFFCPFGLFPNQLMIY